MKEGAGEGEEIRQADGSGCGGGEWHGEQEKERRRRRTQQRCRAPCNSLLEVLGQRRGNRERGVESRAVLMQLGLWKLKVQFIFSKVACVCVCVNVSVVGWAVSFHIYHMSSSLLPASPSPRHPPLSI